MHCLISVILDRWSAIHREAQAHKRLILDAASPGGVERPPEFRAAKGMILVVDWDGGEVLGAIELDKPMGFLVEHDRLHVALWDHDEVRTLRGGAVERCIRHPWFNHIHTIDRSPRGLLLSSSGSDLLAEVDDEGRLLWSMFMFEHVHQDRFRFARNFDRARNYNGRYLPAALTTHPNSAIAVDERRLLATLFSTGELLAIDRGDDEHVEVRVVLDGLRRPHSIRRRPGGYSLADTEGGRVLLLDERLELEAELPVEAGWIQDAVLAGERLLVVGNRKIAVPALRDDTASEGDGASNHVIELRDGAAIKRLDFGPERRIYMVEPISAAQAETLAHGFGRELELDDLRWGT